MPGPKEDEMEPIAAVGAAVVVVLGVIVALLLRGRGAHPGPATPLPLADPRDPSLQDEVRRRLATGDKIAAIRLYRERTGADLRDAKRAVEEMAGDGP
jgi:ribosomal protein L7/L12